MNQGPYANVGKHMVFSTEQLEEPYWTASDEVCHLNWLVTTTPRDEAKETTVILNKI